MSNIKRNILKYTEIPGFEGYLISKGGEIFSKKVNRILTNQINTNGYAFVRSHKNNNQHSFLVHRLLAFVFLDLPSLSSELEVDHIDTNRLNNDISNLQVLTPKQHHFKTHGPYAETIDRYCFCGKNYTSLIPLDFV